MGVYGILLVGRVRCVEETGSANPHPRHVTVAKGPPRDQGFPVYLGDDGTHHTIVKSRGGDQGDAVTAVLFPLVYRRVTLALRMGATAIDPDAREYAYQDDAELICTMPALAAASAAFDEACKDVALRANL